MRSILVLALGAITLPASAATFTVDTTSDAALTACTAAAADCSLRGAIMAANTTPGTDTIAFDLPVSDPGYRAATQDWRIGVGTTALPLIEDGVLIDGYTQPGASANTLAPDQGGLNAVIKIEIQPIAQPVQINGLDISLNFFNQSASTFRGLAIGGFATQIVLSGGAAHRIEGCFIGTDARGLVSARTGNGAHNGVRLFSAGPYVIGGTLPATRNLLSGLTNAISSFSATDGWTLQGNLVGTDSSGTQALANTDNALSFTGTVTNARIGGTTAAARNVIAASRFSGIYLSASNANAYAGTRIEGNYFGTDWRGRRALGNGLNPASPSQPQATINLFTGSDCMPAIGGLAPGAANLIAFGGAAGIQVSNCTGANLRGNRYLGNRGVAIDLSPSSNANGPSANDANDADEGGNRGQNFPELTLPANFPPSGGNSVALSLRVDTAPANATYPLTVDFYRAACGGGSQTPIASTTINAAQAQQTLPFTLTAADGGNVLPLTALATDAAGNTSEFTVAVGETLFADGFEDEAAAFSTGRCD